MAKISKKTALLWVLIIGAVVAVWRFVWDPIESKKENQEVLENAVVTPVQKSENTPEADTTASTVKESSVRTSYKNPGGEDEVGFSISVDESGVITNATVEVLAKNPTSKTRQNAFAAGLPKALQGKKLSDLTAIDKVGGSSLTTNAFNASLAQLKAGI